MRVFFLIVLSTLISGPAWATGLSTSISSNSVSNKSKFWGAVMTEFYGRYNKRRNCWIGKIGGERYCMRPHKLQSVSVGSDRRHHFVVMGGYQINGGGGRDECHACSGVMGLAVLDDEHRKMKVVAKNSLTESIGSWGQIPGEASFELRKIGRNADYGWTISSGYSGQGYTSEGVEIQAVIGDQFRSLGRFPKGWDDSGNCDGGKNISSGKGCTDVNVQLSFIPDDQSAFYPVLLEMSGIEEGATYSRRYRIPYDEGVLSYKKPKDLPEGF